MNKERTLVQGDVAAGKEIGRVSCYLERVRGNAGANLVKRQVEMDLCVSYAAGPKILVVGKGLESPAFAASGFDVAAVDGSQAGQDECLIMAPGVPIESRNGGTAALPFHDEQYHTLVALNISAQLPNWQASLMEWKRVVVPGGRIIFDIRSLDHISAACGEDKTGDVAVNVASMWVTASDLVEQANRLGLTIKGMMPYGAFAGGEDSNCWLNSSLGTQFWWDRFMSLLPVDERLFKFVLFLEEQCVSCLGSVATGHMMVILENRADEAANESWLNRNQHLNEMLLKDFSLSSIMSYLPQPFDAWCSTLNAHLDYLRNRVFFYHLWSKLFHKIGLLDLESCLAPRHIQAMQCWCDEDRHDQETLGFAQDWYRQPGMNELLEYKGVPLGPGMEYLLMQDLLSAAANMPDKTI